MRIWQKRKKSSPEPKVAVLKKRKAPAPKPKADLEEVPSTPSVSDAEEILKVMTESLPNKLSPLTGTDEAFTEEEGAFGYREAY
jgi:hypothetical protein